MNCHKACTPGKPAEKSAQFLLPMFAAVLFAIVLDGCSSSVKIPASPAAGPRLYMSPAISGGSSTSSIATYSIDLSASPPAFIQETFAITQTQSGAQVNYSGVIASPGLLRGLEELEPLCTPVAGGCSTQHTTPIPNGWAVELAGQSGGLLQLPGQPFVPLVPAVNCPSMKSAETFLFVTMPSRLIVSGTGSSAWNPGLETAYGSVDISISGSTVTFANARKYLMDGTFTTSSATGACSPTVYGNTIAVPPNPAVDTLGHGSPQVTVGIGPSNLLVEAGATPSILGAGNGAIGLPKPSSQVDTNALIGKQYLGFFWGTGLYTSASAPPQWSSSPASFGFPNGSSNCPAITPHTGTSGILYGGDFTNNDPTSSTSGYGNCDFAIEFGTQDTSTNGLFPATVHVLSGFANKTFQSYTFPAVAIAGQLGGKYAVFLIGVDTTGSPNQAWGVYLIQSN